VGAGDDPVVGAGTAGRAGKRKEGRGKRRISDGGNRELEVGLGFVEGDLLDGRPGDGEVGE
jgi:hypothetical protein